MRILALLVLALATGLIPGVASAAGETPASLAQSMLPRAQQVGTVESVEVIGSSLGRSQSEFDPQFVPGSNSSEEPSTTVNIVVMRGQFTDTLAKTPQDATIPTGTVMAFTVIGTGEVVEVYVGNRLPQTGTVVLKANISSTTAKTVRARTARHRRRLVAKSATWGNKCRTGSNQHCYALAKWTMNSKEYIFGSETLQNTSQMDVPRWQEGDFVDDEEWLSFFNSPVGNPYWTEMGQEGGDYHNCCSLYSFFAYQNHSGYHAVFGPEKPLSAPNWYTMRSAGGGTWCFYIGWAQEYKQGCVEGFESVSKEVEDGVEVDDEEQPVNAGYVQATWIAEHGEFYNWDSAHNGLWNEAGEVSYNGLCIAPYTPWNFPGNVYYGNYGSCP
jgi:hypothetical protein